ncbi:MAG: flagellar basal-body MS-ring/collar protein FliF [Solirubrobacterales bacterium]
MNKLSAMFKNLIAKWNEMSKKKKAAFAIIFTGILTALIFLGVYLSTPKYEVLFSNLDSTDSAAIYNQLKADKVTAKVQGNSILVPKSQVDEVRMKVLSEVTISNGSQGFELLDKSKFGTTDEEMKINYQRALQGELERTIKSFSQIEGARVHLVIPESTAFVKDTTPGSASVTVVLKPGQSLNSGQVKAIISLISGAVENIPKENVQVIDDKLNLISQGVIDGSSSSSDLTSTEKQQDMKSSYESQLEKKVGSTLEAIYGKDKVKVNINADLDFDAVQQESTTYDPKSVIVSQHISETGTGGTGTTSSSPVDNNMSNTTTTGAGSNSTTKDVTTNYDVSKVEQKTIKAPGSVKRLTTSIVIDGNIDDATKNSVKNLVVSAIGYSDTRGDNISVEGLPFDTTAKEAAKKEVDAMNAANAKAKKLQMYEYIGAGVLGLLLLVGGFIMYKKKKKGEQALEEQIVPKGLDVLIDEATHEKPIFKDINLEVENENTHMENQIKKYAKDKPEQVVDIVKTWLAEDER